jgi:hypothetical protein
MSAERRKACSNTKPLKGGKATTMNKSAQGIEQTVMQSDNPAQASRQDQETIKTRSYTLPAGSRIEEMGFAGAFVVVTRECGWSRSRSKRPIWHF